MILGAIAIILIVLYLHYSNTRRKKKKIQQFRSDWGKLKTEPYYFDTIRAYSDSVSGDSFHTLSEQTINDIDFYGLFAFVDRTVSRVGQQYLFKKMIQPTREAEDKLERVIDLFSQNKDVREEVQFQLSKLSNHDAYYIQSLLKDNLVKRPTWLRFLILDIILMGCLIIFSFKYPICLIFLALLFSLNILLHYWNKSNAFQFVKSFPQLSALLYCAQAISKVDVLFYSTEADTSILNLKTFSRRTWLINLDNGITLQSELSQVGLYFFELLKAFFLIEVLTLFRVVKEIETKKSSILILFEYVGRIDAAFSVASLRAGALKTCKPEFSLNGKKLITINAYHPLIDDCVKNDLSINGMGVLITGSNMSGKTTFLRTLAINSILAQTIYTCFADEFKSPLLKEFSSIRIDDNLFQGKSYYFEEVNIMGSLLKEAETTDQNLFILDEVFKGTNTLERVAAAKAILSYLNRNQNIVVVSTHDIELSEMLAQEYELFHFTETVENDQLNFDHKIKSGKLTTRNAIKILELANYPTEVLREAKRLSGQQNDHIS